MSEPRRRLLAGMMAAAVGWLMACAGPSPSADHPADTIDRTAHRGPVVLVTFANLRADLLASAGGADLPGAPWVPTLDALYDGLGGARGWLGVSASSSPVPAFASLALGVDPWQHGVLSHLSHERRPALSTLGSALAAQGFTSSAYLPSREPLARFGGFDGIEALHDLGDGSAALNELGALDGSAHFVWVHIPVANPPLQDHRHLVPRLADRRAVGPIDSPDLLPYADPDRPLPDDLARDAIELYRQEAAWGDQLLGQLLEAIISSGRADETLLLVTALHGSEFGEHDQALFAQNLGRESIEVPLVVRLPLGFERPLADHERWVAAPRLWATLVEAAGGTPSPIHLPSLFHRSSAPILSSLFAQGDTHRFAVIEPTGDGEAVQLLWSSRFAEPETDYYSVQAAEAGRRGRDHRPSRRLRARLARAMASELPLSGIDPTAPPELQLERWPAQGAAVAIQDSALEARLAIALRARFLRFSDRERTLAAEVARWHSGQFAQ